MLLFSLTGYVINFICMIRYQNMIVTAMAKLTRYYIKPVVILKIYYYEMKENFELYYYLSNRHLQRTVSVDKSRLLVFQQNMVIFKIWM